MISKVVMLNELFINRCLVELSWLVNGIRYEIFWRNPGKTETGYIIPEKIDSSRLIIKLIGSACLKYKTNDNAKNDNAKKGIIMSINNKNEKKIEANEKSWSLISWRKRI